MLVIGRGEKQSILIGEDIEVFVDKIYSHNGKLYVKLAIDAPRDIKLVRKELTEVEIEIIPPAIPEGEV